MDKLFEYLEKEAKVVIPDELKKELKEKNDKLVEDRVEAKLAIETEKIEDEAIAIIKEKVDETEEKAADESAKIIVEKIKKNDEETVKEIGEITDKLSDFIEVELPKRLPKDYTQLCAESAILKPMVEKFKDVFNEHYIHLEPKTVDILSDAKKKISEKDETIAKLHESNITLEVKNKEMQKETKIDKVCDGLTDTQKKLAKKLLMKEEVEDIESKFENIRDDIVKETVGKKPDEEGKEDRIRKFIKEESEKSVENTEEGSQEKKPLTRIGQYKQDAKRFKKTRY